MTKIDWYFDFISPFAYLQLARINQLPRFQADNCALRCRPILLAGLLNHFGQKGPAEIPEKRRQTYRFCQWYADRHDIPFRFPPSHPFNPLSALRLAVAVEGERSAVETIFNAVFGAGEDLNAPPVLDRIGRQIGLCDPAASIHDPEIKQRLRSNTENAISKNVFGVPTMVVEGEKFWGVDSTEMCIDYLNHRKMFERGDYPRLASLPTSASRF